MEQLKPEQRRAVDRAVKKCNDARVMQGRTQAKLDERDAAIKAAMELVSMRYLAQVTGLSRAMLNKIKTGRKTKQ